MRIVTCCLALLLMGATSCQAAEPSPGNLGKLTTQADEVLKLSPMEGRAKVGVVFAAAEGLEKAAREREALAYYERGLRFYAWALPQQLKYATLLMKSGDKSLAIERANLVAEYAEEDELIIPALRLLGRDKEVPPPVTPVAKLDGAAYTVVLVPIGQVDTICLREVQADLQKELGITVLLQSAPVKVPGPSRQGFKELAAHLRKSLVDNEEDPRLVKVLKDSNLTAADLKDDEVAVKVFRDVIAPKAKEQDLAAFDFRSQQLREKGNQWDAFPLLAAMAGTLKPYEQRKVRYVGVTQLDIYADDNAFQFGQASGSLALVSCCRFTASFNGEPPKRHRLRDRTLKQCLASIGHVFGLERCSDLTCARVYPHSLIEHDAKLPKLCAQCKKAFQQVFAK